MKISFLKYSLTKGGGISNLVLDLSEAFTKAGQDVSIITSASWKPINSLIKLNIVNTPQIKSLSFINAAVKCLKEINSDICFVFWHPSDIAALLAKEIHKIPYILVFQGISQLSIVERSHRLKIWLKRVKISHYLTLKRADVVIGISNYIKSILKNEFGISNPLRIYNGVDLEKFKLNLDGSIIRSRYGIDDTFTLLYVGRLASSKGIEYLIKAVAVLRKERKNIKLLIAGRGPLENKIKIYIDKLKLKKSVQLLGFVPANVLPNLYASCDIFVFPTLWEGFGLPPLEAMACGKPVIATNVCSIPEIIDKCGILVPPKSSDALANAILRLLEDENLRQKFGRLGMKRAKEFGIKKTVKQYLRLLDYFET